MRTESNVQLRVLAAAAADARTARLMRSLRRRDGRTNGRTPAWPTAVTLARARFQTLTAAVPPRRPPLNAASDVLVHVEQSVCCVCVSTCLCFRTSFEITDC